MSRKKRYKHDRKKEIKLEKFALLGLAAVTVGMAGTSLVRAEDAVTEPAKTLVDTPEAKDKEQTAENNTESTGEISNQVPDKENQVIEGEKPALQTVTFDVVEEYHYFVAGGIGTDVLSRKKITLKPGESYTLQPNTYKDFKLDMVEHAWGYDENVKNIGRTITNNGSEKIEERYTFTFAEIIREVPDPTDPTSPALATGATVDKSLKVSHVIDADEEGRGKDYGLTRTYHLPAGKRFNPKDLANPAYGTLLKYELHTETSIGSRAALILYYKSIPKATLVSPTTNVSVALTGADVAAVDKIVADKVSDTSVLAKLPAGISPNNVELYDVKTQKTDGSFVQISGEATVTIPVDSSRKVAKVIYFLPETGAVEELPFELSADGKYVHFKVTHFSNYGVVYQSQDTEKPNPQPNPTPQPDPAPQPELKPELNLKPQDNGKDKDSKNLSEEPKKFEDVKSDPSKKEIEKTEDKEKTLPKTGESSSLLGSVGAVLLGMVTLLKFSFKNKRN